MSIHTPSFYTPTPDQALVGLRAMMTVVTASGPIDPTRRAVLDAVQKHVLHTDYALDRLERIEPAAVVAAFSEPKLREQLSRALCLQVMIPDKPASEELLTVERFVQTLGGPRDALERMREGYLRHMTLLRFDAARSSFMGDSLRRKFAEEGAGGVFGTFGEILGIHENPALAARYHALARLPEGSLGRSLHAFYTQRGFKFPGEHDGAPETIATHDLTHVLTGCNTDLPSEACVTAFQAGYRREGPFAGLLFVLLNMEKGVRMTKLAPGAVHMFAEPGMAERIVSAWRKGTDVNCDLVQEWDYWPDMPRPVEDVRKKLNVVEVAT